MEKLLEIKDLRVIFKLQGKEITAVEAVSLDILHNETLVLAGESGSGKTITALSITRILPANAKITSGKIIFQGADLLCLEEAHLIDIRGKEIAYIFQEPASYLNPVFTIGSQISEAVMLHQQKNNREARAEVMELLAKVKISDPERVYFDYPHQLSGGMNQRALIAMALACRPKLLIADEPTTSLDVTVEAQILNLLLELKKQMGFSILFITHNLSIAQRIADRVCVMYQGRIVEEQDKKRIFDSAQHFHTKELIKAYEKIGKI